MNIKKGAMHVFIANLCSLLIGLFTGFILPKFLSIETYSDIKLFQLYIAYIGIVHLGFADGMYLRNGGKTLDQIDLKEVKNEFFTFKVFQFIITILLIVIAAIFGNKILLYCTLVILPINISGYLKNLYEAIGEFKKYSRFMNINTIFIFIVNIFLLLIIKTDNSKIYLIGYVIAYLIYWIIVEKENRKFLSKEKSIFTKKYLIEDIKSGFFLMIGNFCNIIFTTIDRIFVKCLFDNIKFAFYSFAVSIENLISVFITPISTVMYNYLCNNNSKEKVIRLKRIILVFSTFIIAVIFPAKFIIKNWIPKYYESISILFYLFAAQYISIIVRCVHINLYKAEKKQNRYFLIMLLMVILSTILNGVLYLVYNSMEMIAIATILTNIIWFIIGEINFKQYKMEIKDYIYTFLIMCIFVVSGMIEGTYAGGIVYLISSIMLVILLMPDVLRYFINEAKKIITKYRHTN